MKHKVSSWTSKTFEFYYENSHIRVFDGSRQLGIIA